MASIPVMEVAKAAARFWRANTAKVAGPLGLLAAAGMAAAYCRYVQSPAMLLAVVVQMAAWIVGAGALLRLAFAGDRAGAPDARIGPVGLQWTRTESRLLGVYAVVTLARFLPAGIGLVALAVAAGATTPAQTPTLVIGAAVALIGFGLAFYIWLGLSLSPAASVAEGRTILTWGLTKGARWRMLAAYALVLGPVVVVTLGLGAAIVTAAGPGVEAQRTGALLAGVAMIWLVAFAYLPLSIGVGSDLYRRLRATA